MPEANSILGRNELFSAMSGGKPFKSFIKTTLGKVAVVIWDNFNEAPIEIILKGDPKRKEETSIVDVWSEKESVFFTRINHRLFDKKLITEFKRPEVAPSQESPVSALTDEDLDKIVGLKFIALQHKLNAISEIDVLFRLRDAVERNEKSDKYMKAVDARISEVQLAAGGLPDYEAEQEEE